MLVTRNDAPAANSPLAYPDGAAFAPDRVRFGPGLDDETLGRLVVGGSGEGRRVLELGCGDGSNAVALARQGARVIVVDSSAARLAAARNHAEAHDVRIEFHHGDLADLAFVRADQIDLCLAIYSLDEVPDVSRVFRQVHRVLRTEAPMVISLPHPSAMCIEADDGDGPPVVVRSAFDPAPVAVPGTDRRVQAHRISDVFTALGRSNFRVDTLIEPQAMADAEYSNGLEEWIPSTVILRGRKQGI